MVYCHMVHVYMSFVVMHSCPQNSYAYMGLQYTHTVLYQGMTGVCLGQ